MLNLLVSQYLDFAGLQAFSQRPMYMKDWAAKLNGFLKVNDRAILEDAGRISHQLAEELASKEFERYQAVILAGDLGDLHPDLEAQIKKLQGRSVRHISREGKKAK